MPRTCVYEDCNASVERNPDLKFARFVQPQTDLKRAARWVKLIGRSDFTIKSIKYGTIICQRHFPKGSNLNWRLNKSLEPFPLNVQAAVEELDYFPVQEPKPKNPKCYQSRVAIPVAHGVVLSKNDIGKTYKGM